MALDQPKGWISLILGLILMGIGILPLLEKFKLIGANPIAPVTNILTVSILQYVVAIAGLVLIIDAFMEMDTIRVVSLIIGIIVLASGIIPVLNSFHVIGFTIPYLTVTVYHVVFIIEGIFLIIAAFAMW